MKEYLQKFYEAMQELMDDENLNIINLAEKTNIDRKAITHWFSGRFYPNLESLKKLSNYFHCSIDFLFGLSNDIVFVPIDASDFLTRFKELKEVNHFTDYRISKLCSIGNSTVAKWTLHGRLPETKTIIKLAEIFGSSVEYLIGRCN